MFQTRPFSAIEWGDLVPTTRQDLTVANNAVTQLTVPSNAVGIFVQIETQNIRYTVDGTTPSTNSPGGPGMLMFDGDRFQMNWSQATALKMIADSATNVNVHAQYFRGKS